MSPRRPGARLLVLHLPVLHTALLAIVLAAAGSAVGCGDPDTLTRRANTNPPRGIVPNHPGNQLFEPPEEIYEDEPVEPHPDDLEPFDLDGLDDPALRDPLPFDLEPEPDPDPDADPDPDPDPPEPLRGPPFPIVLVHGFFASGEMGPVDYWWRIPEALRREGHEVYVVVNDPAKPPAERAEHLARFVDDVLASTRSEKVNLVGHSMGGLDSRWLISRLGYGDRVASLTTVATPHRGSPVADAALGLIPGLARPVVDAIASALYGLILGFDDQRMVETTEVLSSAGAVRFNADTPDDPRVAYFSIVAKTSGDPLFLFRGLDYCDAPLWTTFTFLRLVGHQNDGMVPVSSQEWGEVVERVQADHLNQVGHLLGVTGNATNPWRMYVRHAERLRERGF